MAWDDRPVADLGDFSASLPVRAYHFVATRGRPWQGWIALLASVALAWLPAYTLLATNWVRLPETASMLGMTGALAVLSVWWVAGWAHPAEVARLRPLATLDAALVVVLIGALVISVLLTRWLPDAATIVAALRTGDLAPAAAQMNEAIVRFGARFSVWWTGAQGGSVIPDERIFALFAATLIWVAAALSAALTRATRRAFPAMLPLVLLVGWIVFIGGKGQLYFLGALALTLLLHVALDNNRLATKWEEMRADYSTDLLNERWLNAAALASLALILAAVAPVFSIRAISDYYARLVAPIDERIETVRQQAFPNIETAARYSVAGSTSGLPNSFLLGGGPSLDRTRILELRTGEPALSDDAPPLAPYLNATAFTHYTGRGWEPDAEHALLKLPADSRRPKLSTEGRQLLAQTVRTYVPARTLFAAGEFAEAGIETWLQFDAQEQLTAITAGAGSYTLLSLTPALDEDALRKIPPFAAAQPLPAGFDAYLALPPSVTQRTRDLSAQLTAEIASPYDQAVAIQEMLRTFPYSLDISAPPPEVADVADYFLFDLKTGYCDYYATAFVVLARAAGLPTRFMTGYAPGSWLHDARAWIVSAADSHSWPEVYFAGVGWVPFEPTAARAPIARIGSETLPPPGSSETTTPVQSPAAGVDWNAQMLFWLLPAAALVWIAWRAIERLRIAREDPWLALQAWGARAGYPAQTGETPLEYGATVAALAEGMTARTPGEANQAAAAARALGAAVSAAHFAPAAARDAATEEAVSVWRTLRPLLAGLRPPRAPR